MPVLEEARFTVSAVVLTLPNASISSTVIVPDTTPAVSVCAVVVYTNWVAVAARTVSVCIAEVRPVAEAVRVGALARVSTYLKLAVLLPAGIDTEVIVVRPVALSLNSPVAVFELDRFTVSAVVVTLPNASSSWTVSVPDKPPAVSVCGWVVNISLLADAAMTVSVCVAAVRPVAEAVRVGVLARVSTYLKLAVLLPAAMAADVIVVRPVASSLNRPVLVFEVVRFTVSAVVLTLPKSSSSWTVSVPDTTPAVSVCAVVV